MASKTKIGKKDDDDDDVDDYINEINNIDDNDEVDDDNDEGDDDNHEVDDDDDDKNDDDEANDDKVDDEENIGNDGIVNSSKEMNNNNTSVKSKNKISKNNEEDDEDDDDDHDKNDDDDYTDNINRFNQEEDDDLNMKVPHHIKHNDENQNDDENDNNDENDNDEGVQLLTLMIERVLSQRGEPVNNNECSNDIEDTKNGNALESKSISKDLAPEITPRDVARDLVSSIVQNEVRRRSFDDIKQLDQKQEKVPTVNPTATVANDFVASIVVDGIRRLSFEDAPITDTNSNKTTLDKIPSTPKISPLKNDQSKANTPEKILSPSKHIDEDKGLTILSDVIESLRESIELSPMKNSKEATSVSDKFSPTSISKSVTPIKTSPAKNIVYELDNNEEEILIQATIELSDSKKVEELEPQVQPLITNTITQTGVQPLIARSRYISADAIKMRLIKAEERRKIERNKQRKDENDTNNSQNRYQNYQDENNYQDESNYQDENFYQNENTNRDESVIQHEDSIDIVEYNVENATDSGRIERPISEYMDKVTNRIEKIIEQQELELLEQQRQLEKVRKNIATQDKMNQDNIRKTAEEFPNYGERRQFGVKSPVKSQLQQSPIQQSPIEQSPIQQSPIQQSQIRQSPIRQSSEQRTPMQSPMQQSPTNKTPIRNSLNNNKSSPPHDDDYMEIDAEKLSPEAMRNYYQEKLQNKYHELQELETENNDDTILEIQKGEANNILIITTSNSSSPAKGILKSPKKSPEVSNDDEIEFQRKNSKVSFNDDFNDVMEVNEVVQERHRIPQNKRVKFPVISNLHNTNIKSPPKVSIDFSPQKYDANQMELFTSAIKRSSPVLPQVMKQHSPQRPSVKKKDPLFVRMAQQAQKQQQELEKLWNEQYVRYKLKKSLAHPTKQELDAHTSKHDAIALQKMRLSEEKRLLMLARHTSDALIMGDDYKGLTEESNDGLVRKYLMKREMVGPYSRKLESEIKTKTKTNYLLNKEDKDEIAREEKRLRRERMKEYGQKIRTVKKVSKSYYDDNDADTYNDQNNFTSKSTKKVQFKNDYSSDDYNYDNDITDDDIGRYSDDINKIWNQQNTSYNVTSDNSYDNTKKIATTSQYLRDVPKALLEKADNIEKKKKNVALSHANDRNSNVGNINKLSPSWVSKIIDTDADEEKLADVYENGFAIYMQEKGLIPDDFKRSSN